MRCASFDKVVISSCLCHLSVQAISLFFPSIHSWWLFPWMLFFSLRCASRVTEWVCVCVGEWARLVLLWLFMLRVFFSTRNGIGWLWLRLVSLIWNMSTFKRKLRTVPNQSRLTLSLSDVCKHCSQCWNFDICIFFCFFAQRVAFGNTDFNRTHTHMHAENECSKITNCVCHKNAAELPFFPSFTHLFADSTYAQNSTHFVWVAWHCLGFQ